MAGKYRLLVVEDERPLRNLVMNALTSAGYEVFGVPDGLQAMEFFAQNHVDMVILDIIMPHVDGIQVCRWIRQRSDVPIVMLTALDRTEDVVTGFEAGADDYITKPFTFEELRARIEAIFRRMEWMARRRPRSVLSYGPLTVDPNAHRVTLAGQEVHVTPMEFELLYYLMSHAGEAVPKETLFREVWGYEYVEGLNLVEVAVRRLREKIEPDPSRPAYIQTVRGIGYRFVPPEAQGAAS
jgi:DNA-binding response OmpR family regulator